jgi:hypothetical protein
MTIEPEIIGDSRSLFRLYVNHRLVGERLTATEAHILVGDVLQRTVLPARRSAIPLEALNASNDQ